MQAVVLWHGLLEFQGSAFFEYPLIVVAEDVGHSRRKNVVVGFSLHGLTGGMKQPLELAADEQILALRVFDEDDHRSMVEYGLEHCFARTQRLFALDAAGDVADHLDDAHDPAIAAAQGRLHGTGPAGSSRIRHRPAKTGVSGAFTRQRPQNPCRDGGILEKRKHFRRGLLPRHAVLGIPVRISMKVFQCLKRPSRS